MTVYCVDEEHGTPCPKPCDACDAEGCDPNATVEAESADEAMRLAGWSAEYIAQAAQ